MNTIRLLASTNPLDHVVQHAFVQRTVHLPILGPTNFTLVSDHVIMQILAAVLTILVMFRAARYARTAADADRRVPRGLGNFVEVICEYLRKNVIAPALGAHADRFVPYLWTVFFFILFSNILGLIPLEPVTRLFLKDSHLTHGHGIGGTSTGNVWVTASLSVCTLGMIVVNGLRYNGMEFVKHFFQGPAFIAPLIAVLEVIGLVAKTFALTMRLFANMIAGHILLAVLLSFIAMAGASSTALGLFVAVPVVLGSVAINLLELFVAFLQAFIFTFLTALFVGQAVVIHHDHHHGEERSASHAH